jgi:hypothetical protein
MGLSVVSQRRVYIVSIYKISSIPHEGLCRESFLATGFWPLGGILCRLRRSWCMFLYLTDVIRPLDIVTDLYMRE